VISDVLSCHPELVEAQTTQNRTTRLRNYKLRTVNCQLITVS